MSKLNTNLSIADQLKTLQGSVAELTLQSGNSFKGTVKEASNTTVLLAELTGEEFYSAVIAVSQVVAIKVRVEA